MIANQLWIFFCEKINFSGKKGNIFVRLKLIKSDIQEIIENTKKLVAAYNFTLFGDVS